MTGYIEEEILRQLRTYHRQTCNCELYSAHGCLLDFLIDEVEEHFSYRLEGLERLEAALEHAEKRLAALNKKRKKRGRAA